MTNETSKTALITGGSRGLGKDMALQLAREGFDVVVTYHSKADEAQNTVRAVEESGRKAHALQLDVSNSSGFDAFAQQIKGTLNEKFGTEHLNALVNNAGTGHHQDYSETPESALDSMYKIHLRAPYLLTQKLLPVLSDGASIVNISSGLARFSFPGYSAYAAMKGALEVLSRYQAKELGDRRIRVNTVAPGAIETDFGGGAVRDNQDLNNMIASLTALGRVGLPDDIGGVVAFLCSDAAKWVNAQRIEVSGGIFV